MMVNSYVSKKKGPSIQVIGSRQEFLDAGINIDNAEVFKNKHGEERVALRSTQDDEQFQKDVIWPAQELLKSRQKEAPKTAKEWFTAHGPDSQMLVQSLLTLGKKKLTVFKLKQLGNLERHDAEILFKLLFSNGYIDGEGVLKVRGVEELRAIDEFISGGWV